MLTQSHFIYTEYESASSPEGIYWFFSGPFSPIDNFAETPVEVDVGFGLQTYPTSEHAFAAAKAQSLVAHKRIATARSPNEAKALGRAVHLRPDWELIKFQRMWDILLAKFDQNPSALAVLKSTEKRLLVEGNFWDDDTWGAIAMNPRDQGAFMTYVETGHPPPFTLHGRNALGRMLMRIRDEVHS